MPRPIWSGTLSFGLLNIPVSVMSAEHSIDLHFRMLDSRSNTPIRYERVNAETGEEVPWKDIVRAYEYKKGSYVVLEPEDIRSAASERRESIDVETFVDAGEIGPEYFEKPYLLVPGKKAEKGYVLLRETLRRTGRLGIGRVVIRTREYLAAVMPRDNALWLLLLRYPQQLVDADEYAVPEAELEHYRVSPRELEMAGQLIESMSGKWKPKDYKDDFRDRLRQVIEKRMKSKGLVVPPAEQAEEMPANAATNVVDFMTLLQKSLASNRRTPAKNAPSKPATAKKSAPAKRAAAKRATAKKAAPRKPVPAGKKSAGAPRRGRRNAG
ncbi:Ku protein [Frateuria defendens]|uniref:non-homologous end joining protein Ku n=1 Tax=Frateuria defendens TaxID=2219559 RepID=UPI00066FF738|nr:Ku protein [Frateuria defendens]